MRSVVTDQVAWSVCRSVCHTIVSPTKTDEPMEMLSGFRTEVGLENHVLDGSPDPPSEGAILWERSAHCKVYRDFLPSAVQERLNRPICRLDCGLGWAEGSTSSIVFARWRQCALITIEPSMCGGDTACCQITLTIWFSTLRCVGLVG